MVRLIATDIDGVWTDGGMYYTESGDEFKKFNVRDGEGVLLAKAANIPVVIITGEDSTAVVNRANKLNINYFVNIDDKSIKLYEICQYYGVKFSEVAYIGDGLNDLEVLKMVGLSACPSDAPNYIQEHCNVILNKKGGEGVFTEFVEYILKREQPK